MPIIILTGGGGPFMSNMRMGIIIVTTFAGFIYGARKLYRLQQQKKIQYHDELGDIVDIITTVSISTLVGVIVGLLYPICIPAICMYQYCKWKEQHEKKNHAIHQ